MAKLPVAGASGMPPGAGLGGVGAVGESAGEVAVGVVVNAVGGYSRGVLRGVASYAAARGWRLGVQGVNVSEVDPTGRTGRRWDGIIAQISGDRSGERLVEACGAVGLPLVNISSAVADTGLPSVVTDDRQVGRMGAEHLIRVGRRGLVFYGPDRRAFVQLRHLGFMGRCREGGIEGVSVGDREALAGVLAAGVRGGGASKVGGGVMGVMGCNDRAALEVLEVCRETGLRVPEDVAVLGVDDDDLMQSLAYPPLSSVNTARDRVGFEAAALLERLMSGERLVAVEPRLLAPKGVVIRRSTDPTAVTDGDVAEAARFIHANAGRPITVDDVVRSGSVSRRQLERRYRAALGRSLLEEIVRCRVDRARQLLIDTELTLEQIARASGFASASYFSVVFKRNVGMTPRRFRDAYRAGERFSPRSGSG